MGTTSRRRLLVGLVVGCAATASAAVARTPHAGPLSGTWSGSLSGQTAHGVKREHIAIVVNAKQTGGTWRLSNSCHGPLTLDSISNGYHHYLRRRGRGSTCTPGDIDCLMRVGANVYDTVTARAGSAYAPSGTLRRARHPARG